MGFMESLLDFYVAERYRRAGEPGNKGARLQAVHHPAGRHYLDPYTAGFAEYHSGRDRTAAVLAFLEVFYPEHPSC